MLDTGLRLTVTVTISATLTPTATLDQVIQLFGSTDEKVLSFSRKMRYNFELFGILKTLKYSKVLQNASVCMPEGLLCEINQYYEVWLECE